MRWIIKQKLYSRREIMRLPLIYVPPVFPRFRLPTYLFFFTWIFASNAPIRVMRAVKILTDPVAGVRLKASSVTVSTVGLVPQIERFCADPGNGASLAISLHAVTDEVRDKVRGLLLLLQRPFYLP